MPRATWPLRLGCPTIRVVLTLAAGKHPLPCYLIADTGAGTVTSRFDLLDKVKAVFYLPLRDNDGRDLTAEAEAVKSERYVRFAGWTFLGYVKGAYRMADGNQSLDESAAYLVVLDEVRLGELELVLRDFKNKTLQEAIYLEVQRDVEVRFIR